MNFNFSGLVSKPPCQVAASGEDGGGQVGAARLPAGGAETWTGPGALASWAPSLNTQPRPPWLPSTPPDSLRLLPPHQRDLPPGGDPARPGHHELLFPHLSPTASTASSPSAAPVSPAASDGRISPGILAITHHLRTNPQLRIPGCENPGQPGTSMASNLLGASLTAGCPPNLSFFSGIMPGPEHRLNSITTLRLKAKEQMEIFKESCFNR